MPKQIANFKSAFVKGTTFSLAVTFRKDRSPRYYCCTWESEYDDPLSYADFWIDFDTATNILVKMSTIDFKSDIIVWESADGCMDVPTLHVTGKEFMRALMNIHSNFNSHYNNLVDLLVRR